MIGVPDERLVPYIEQRLNECDLPARYGAGTPVTQTEPFLLLETVRDIARVVRVPVSVDMEDGYARDPAVVGTNVASAADAGASGINIEDGSDSPDLLCAKLAAIRTACAQRGTDVFINVRTDVYLRGLAPSGRRVEETGANG